MLTNLQTSSGAENERYLIRETTGPGTPKDPCVRPPKERVAEFDQVLSDFEKRRDTPRKLARAFSIPKAYELIDEAEANAFVNERKLGLQAGTIPDERFKHVSDLITLTDVYFSERRTLALTAIETWCGGLCASMRWRVFEKGKDGKWRELPWIACATMARR